MSEFFLGSNAQACSLPLGSCIRAMQTFGRKWTNCNLVCGRPFRRKSSRFESDDVQILCLICLDFQRFRKIASVPQPIVCTEPIRFGFLFVLISTAPKQDRLENPQPPECQNIRLVSFICLRPLFTKPSETMGDTQKTMTISATSFRGYNRFSPLLMWYWRSLVTCYDRV